MKVDLCSMTLVNILVIFSNDTFIHCVSSSIDGTDAHFSYLSLNVETSTGCKIRTPGSFVYYQNPKIKSIHPTISLLRY